MPRVLICALLVLLPCQAPAEVRQRITGLVGDAETNQPLQFAIIRVENSTNGTTTDSRGRFSLHLESGSHILVVSQLGYRSERRTLEVGHEPVAITLQLHPSIIELPEVVVTPGENPALPIIRRAIENKARQKERLRNYSLSSHSKLVLKASDLRGVAVNDLSDSTFTAIMETQTDAYWMQPDRSKEIVKARKQSAFIPAQSNILISSFFIADFSADELDLGSPVKVAGPISEAGLLNYNYTLTGNTSLDGTRIFVIEISPLADYDPLLQGTIWIAADSYALTKVDVALNDAALPTFFKRLCFTQNFRLFDSLFWMPADVVVSGDLEIAMIVRANIRLDVFSVLQNYVINRAVNEEVFDRTFIKILPEADKRDTTYWAQHQAIPNSQEEIEEYHKSDSLKVVFDARRNRYGLLNALAGKELRYDETRVNLPGLFSLYGFNRVKGHSLSLPLSVTRPLASVQAVSGSVGYGFSDRRWKYTVDLAVELSRSPGVTFTAGLADRLGSIDEQENRWSRMSTALANLFFKYDQRDYYYVQGWKAGVQADLGLLLPTTVDVRRESYLNAMRNTHWSLTRRQWPFRENPAINEGSITSLGATLSYDGREFIDNAGEFQRFGDRSFVPTIGVQHNWADIVGGRSTFTLYHATLHGKTEIGAAGTTTYRLGYWHARGGLPTQRLFNLLGSVPYDAESWRFRTLDFREFGGDRRATAFVEHDFGDRIFRWLRLPFLKSSRWGLVVFGGAGWTTMRAETRALQTVPVQEAKTPLYEAGFGISRIVSFVRVDFAWRLSRFREGMNFFFGVSVPGLE